MRNDNQLIWEAFQSKITEARRRTQEENDQLVKNLERYQYLMRGQEQGEGDYFDWSEFEDYDDYEAQIEKLEKDAEANGYLKQLKDYADFDLRSDRNEAQLNNDPLEQKAYQVARNRINKKTNQLNKQDTGTMIKRLKEPRGRFSTTHSVRGMKKPNLP